MADSKRIWVINHYAYPKGYGFHTRQDVLANILKDNDYKVTIFASSFNHLLSKEVEFEGESKVEIHDGIEYVWLKTKKYSDNGIGRIKNIFEFSYRFNQIYENRDDVPDIVWASSPQPFVIYNALKVKKRFNCKFIFEERDIWPLTLTELSGKSKYNPLVILFDYLQTKAYTQSDLIVSPLDNLKEFIEFKGIYNKKVEIIPQPLAELKIRKIDISLPNDKFIIGYVGSIGESNSIFNLIKAANILKDNDKLYFLIVGDGPQFHDINNYCKKHSMHNIMFTGKVKKEEAMYLIDKCDIVYKGNPDIDLYKYGIASVKLVEYMLLGKPIVHATNIKNDLVSLANAGIVIESNNEDLLATKILELYENKDLLRLYSNSAKSYAEYNFNTKIISEKLVRIVDKVYVS